MLTPPGRLMAGYPPQDVDPITAILALSGDALFDNTNAANLFQDTARTTPVASITDPCGSSADLTPNARHIEQATAGFRPLWNGEGLEFDGIDDFMKIDWGVGNDISQPVTHVFSFKPLTANAASGNQFIIDGPAAGFRNAVWYNNNSSFRYSAGTVLVDANAVAETDYVMTVENNGTSSNAWLNGPQIVTNQDFGTNPFRGPTWGAVYDGTGNGNIVIYRHFIKQGILSAAERALVEAWVDVKGVL